MLQIVYIFLYSMKYDVHAFIILVTFFLWKLFACHFWISQKQSLSDRRFWQNRHDAKLTRSSNLYSNCLWGTQITQYELNKFATKILMLRVRLFTFFSIWNLTTSITLHRVRIEIKLKLNLTFIQLTKRVVTNPISFVCEGNDFVPILPGVRSCQLSFHTRAFFNSYWPCPWNGRSEVAKFTEKNMSVVVGI